MVMNIVDERSKARKVVEDTNFDYLIMFLICMDAVVLGLLTVGFADVNFVTTLFLLDRLCMAIFIVEMLIKMYAYGPRFFKSGWNVFDLVVITVSSLPVASCLIVLRTFRLFRLLRYVNRFKPMKNIINIFFDDFAEFCGDGGGARRVYVRVRDFGGQPVRRRVRRVCRAAVGVVCAGSGFQSRQRHHTAGDGGLSPCLDLFPVVFDDFLPDRYQLFLKRDFRNGAQGVQDRFKPLKTGNQTTKAPEFFLPAFLF